MSCQPGSIAIGQTTDCLVTVSHGGAGALAPSGVVTGSSDSPGSFAGPCTLTAAAAAGTATCHLRYTASAVGSGSHRLTAAYGGDAGHKPSAGQDTVSVAAQGPLAPVLSSVRLAKAKFRLRRGTTLFFNLSEPATLTAAITRTIHGHKVRGRCRTGARKGKRCSVTLRRGRLTFGGTAGTNQDRFRPSRLTPGRYVATLTAVDAGGRSSSAVPVRFTIAKPAKKHARRR
jgi:hypothetical protein